VAAGSCCSQILWIKQQLLDYDLKLGCVSIKCDNTSAINLTKNPVLHWRTKHIEIQHHFFRDHVEKKDVTFEYVDTKSQLADIFTNPLPSEYFLKIRRELGILDTSCLKQARACSYLFFFFFSTCVYFLPCAFIACFTCVQLCLSLVLLYLDFFLLIFCWNTNPFWRCLRGWKYVDLPCYFYLFLLFRFFVLLLFVFFPMLYVRGSHHQLFDMVGKGEIEADIVLLYMFLMMFFSFVYLFDDCLVFNMLIHPTSMSLGLRTHLCHVHYLLTRKVS